MIHYPCRSFASGFPLSARYRRDSSRVITDGRVTGIKVQRTTTTPGNPKVGNATSRAGGW